MMIFPLYAAVAGLLIGQVVSQASLSPCAAGCVDSVLGNTSKTSCTVGDLACVCSYTGDVSNGIRDCLAQACASESSEQVGLADAEAKQRCAAASTTASPSPTAASTTTSPPAEVAPTTTSTSPPAETSTPPLSTTEAVSSATSSTVESTSAPVSASTTEASSTSSAAASSTLVTSTSASSSTTPSSTTSGATAAATGQSSEGQSASGLSVAAKAGIGAGVGVALVMTAIVGICLTVRRKQQQGGNRRGQNIEISGPLPGGGRQWATEEKPQRSTTSVNVTSNGRQSYSSELDRHARRYEEMVPHTKPHTMI